jgi:hypothetical protein
MLTARKVQLFNLAAAPANLREAAEFAALREGGLGGDSPVHRLQVGHGTGAPQGEGRGEGGDNTQGYVTFPEYLLHRWFCDNGAQEGETVYLVWDGD